MRFDFEQQKWIKDPKPKKKPKKEKEPWTARQIWLLVALVSISMFVMHMKLFN